MTVIRVLVAEDSATARELLIQVLTADPEIEVVGVARDGVEAVALTSSLRPDLVTMDIHMPRLDGLAATQEIMCATPTPIVIVTGSHRVNEVQASMDTLRSGALEVLEKPPAPGSPGFAAAAERLVSVVKAMARVKVVRHWRHAVVPGPAATMPPPPSAPGGVRARVVAIASSTGGPAALQHVLAGLPADFPAPILVAQHITVGFTEGLAAWLGSVSPLRVKVADHGETIAGGTLYVAPDDRHLGVTQRGVVSLSSAAPVGGFRPSASYLFESVANAFGASALAVILTGMGEDGVLGLRAVVQAGGRVIAQDETSSVVFGMPRAAIESGLAHMVLPLDQIAQRLASLV
ncbi:MAG: cheB [Acidimicrobiales bacterium]|nr:cheB [Acidimicrobiales bacterium]